MLTRVGGRSPLRVAVLCSRRAPGLEYLLHSDVRRGWSYELEAVVTTDPECVERALVRAAGVPFLVHDFRAFPARRDYDRRTAALLAPFRPELILLSGYLRILSAPMLDAHPHRIINIHDSDLTLLGPDGLPRYRGLHSTRDAIFAGERETRSTIHWVTEQVDVGPVVLRSDSFRTHSLIHDARRWGAIDVLKAYAYAHREWMMRAAWGPMLARAIELIAQGAVPLPEPVQPAAGA